MLLPSFTFYVTELGESMMGVDLFDALGGTIEICRKQVQAISPMVSSSSVQLAQFPNLTKEFGTLKGFVHTPRIDPPIRPVQQKFWQPAISMLIKYQRSYDGWEATASLSLSSLLRGRLI